MNIITNFNPITVPSGSFDMTIQNGGHLLIMNESSSNLVLVFGNGANSYVPANDKRLYCINGQMAQPHTRVTYSTQSTLPNQNIVNQVTIEAFQPGETVSETYPSPIIRNTSVAGAITATEINLQTAVPPVTQVVTVTNTNTGFQNVALRSDGSLDLGGINFPGVLNIVNTTMSNNAGFSSSFLELVVPNTSTNTTFRILNDSNATAIAEIDANGTLILSADGLTSLTITPVSSSISGTVSGTITMYQYMVGMYKRVFFDMQNYQSGAAGNFTLPAPFTTKCFIVTGGIGTGGALILRNAGGTAQTIGIITALAAAGGTRTPQTNMNQDSIAECIASIAIVDFAANTGSHTGTVEMWGI